MTLEENPWLETVAVADGTALVSKFLNSTFSVPAGYVKTSWRNWSPVERLRLAVAFSVRTQLNDQDREILEFLIENGDSSIWSALALLVAEHQSRPSALEFLLRRVTQGGRVANYYQALGRIRAQECVPVLERALLTHRRDVNLHPTLADWDDRFIYLDYLACSATLFVITGEEKYRQNLKEMLRHPDEVIVRMVRMIVSTQHVEGV